MTGWCRCSFRGLAIVTQPIRYSAHSRHEGAPQSPGSVGWGKDQDQDELEFGSEAWRVRESSLALPNTLRTPGAWFCLAGWSESLRPAAGGVHLHTKVLAALRIALFVDLLHSMSRFRNLCGFHLVTLSFSKKSVPSAL